MKTSDIPEPVWRIVLDLRARQRGTKVTGPMSYSGANSHWDVLAFPEDSCPHILVTRRTGVMEAAGASQLKASLENQIAASRDKAKALKIRMHDLQISVAKGLTAVVDDIATEIEEAETNSLRLEKELQATLPKISPTISSIKIPMDKELKIDLAE